MLILTLLKNIVKKYNIQKLTVSISNLILVPTVVNKNATRRRRWIWISESEYYGLTVPPSHLYITYY